MRKLMIGTALVGFVWLSSSIHSSTQELPPYATIPGTWAHETLARLTTRQKIGQLFMVATASCFEQPEEALASAMLRCPYRMDPEYIEQLIIEYHIGGLIFLFKSTPDKQIEAINTYQNLSTIPLLIGQDCEWGHSMRLYDTIRFPRNMTLGALSNKQLIYELGKEIGRQCKEIGVHINFAPVVDVNNNPANPVIHDRSFGENPQSVSNAGLLMMQGLQDVGVLACAKHFPGHGDTAIDSHLDLPVIPHTKARFNTIELVPFKHLVEHGVSAIMTAHVAAPAFERNNTLPASLSPAITTNLLRHKLGFTGLAISDGLGMQALTNYYKAGEIELKALLAGSDILLCPLDVPAAVAHIEQAIHDGLLTLEELDARVLKILKAKEWAGCHNFKPLNTQNIAERLITDNALKLKQQLYHEAITVVPLTQEIELPLSANASSSIAVLQSGGLQDNAFKQAFSCAFPEASYQHIADNSATVLQQIHNAHLCVIPVFGVTKFAQQNYGINTALPTLVAQLRAQGTPVIVILFGTPYSATFFSKASTLIVAYEDDPDAQEGVVRVLRGQQNTLGTLPVTIP